MNTKLCCTRSPESNAAIRKGQRQCIKQILLGGNANIAQTYYRYVELNVHLFDARWERYCHLVTCTQNKVFSFLWKI